MKISALLIVQNNMKTLPDCLASLDFADEVIVVDGGSTDGTLDYLRTYENGDDLRLVESPWPGHFGEQRQVAFDKAMCGDEWWWIRIDSDEVMPPIFRANIRRLLAELPPQIMAARIKQYNLIRNYDFYSSALGGWETHARIWRSSRKLRWVGQVHEFVCRLEGGVLMPIPDAETASLNLAIIHAGWLDDARMKRKEEQYIAMPDSGFTKAGDLTEREHIARRLPRPLRLDKSLKM